MRLSAALSPRAVLLALVACCGWGALPAQADGNVGCLFSSSLCIDKVEWCYDDYAFGKCVQLYGNVGDEELARHELTTAELRAFEQELQRLLLLGYRWSHAYTQCVLQAMLYATKNRLHYEASTCDCDHLADQDLTAALGAFEAGNEVDPESVAFVRFTPNSDVDASDFANEVYFPPEEKDFLASLPIMPEPEMPIDAQETPSEVESWQEQAKRAYRKKKKRSKDRRQATPRENFQVFSRIYNTPGDFREGHETRDLNIEDLETLFNNNEFPAAQETEAQLTENNPVNSGYPSSLSLTADDILYLLQPENEDELKSIIPQYNQDPENSESENYKLGEKDLLNKWLETQDLDQLKAALSELKEPYSKNVDPYYLSTSEYLTKNRLQPDRFNQYYNTPDRFRQGYESRDSLAEDKQEVDGEIPEQRIYIDEDDQDHYKEDSGSGEHDGNVERLRELEYLTNNEVIRNEYPKHEGAQQVYDGEPPRDDGRQAALIARLLNTWRSGGRGSPVYTEGGLVYVGDPAPTNRPESGMASHLLGPELGALLADYEWGFRRRERLDVKKPGPPFDVHNTHFKQDVEQNQNKTSAEDESVTAPLMVKKELHDEPEKTSDINKIHDNYDVDSSYAYVGFKDSIRTWKEGARVVRTIGELLHLEPSAFSYPRVDRNEVTFRVEENSKSLNASEVAGRIDGIKDELKKELGVEVTSAGVGDKAKYPAVLRLEAGTPSWTDWGDWENWSGAGTLWAALIAGTLAAGVAATALFLLARHHRRRRDKLRDLAGGDTEASQDYQDLCRARMSGKWQTAGSGPEKVGGAEGKQETGGQRITSLSRESDGNSPSTRSSTSSWSEEPALTNMDISTGHMVLTYMEDHLKNKDRLEQEWRALCAYEAEPCATTAAERPENLPKNRSPGVLPYDHARLVLNDVTNMSSSDYINASTITDHDPRNPAYIAAQGPLAETAADWWQMVWEQGSVVLVMLTRLTEGGTALCHRYWPEEGSQLYHIYEVHLVSEHIWCDDYLVRSFYLKNLKTGETRTVTQFHFLSWPDRGVPSSTKALLEFRRKVNKSYRGRSCPIVVHCSDGAGRTGTYCLIDMVLNRMAKGAKEIDIAATLEHIRDQRPHMVTTKQQFEFVLMAVAEEVHAILKALPAQLQQQHEKREKELAAEKEKLEKQEKEK